MNIAEHVKNLLARIARLDRQLNAIIELNPDVHVIASNLDASFGSTDDAKGLLYGVPVLLKDNIDTGDKMLTTAGSLALVKAPSPTDAPLVEAMRKAGAVILGKTNLSEFANIRSRASSSGWSSRGGLTRNPHNLSRTASGSSSGSAAAVAAGFAPIAIGTETNGSIVSPANACGIVGFKPSRGKISQQGIVPISSTYDTAGPLARSVTDAALAMSVMSGENFHGKLSEQSLSGKRVGVLNGRIKTHADLTGQLSKASAVLEELGAVLVPISNELTFQSGWPHNIHVMLCELVWTMEEYLTSRGQTVDVHNLQDIIAFNKAHAAETMPYFGQDLFELALTLVDEGRDKYEAAVIAADELAGVKGLTPIFDEQNLDVLVGITDGPAGVIDLLNGESGRHVSLAAYPAVAGFPHLTVPCGDIQGMPVGLSFIGRHNDDANVLSYGFAYEAATMSIINPQLPEDLN